MTAAERNQMALERFCDPKRRRSPWAAGVDYERFVGFTLENSGYDVTYFGATEGKKDRGIDLIAENQSKIVLIQCKRLSKEKGLPVRENVVAQVYGAAEFYRMKTGVAKPVCPMIVSTYCLSEEAREFSKLLGVEFWEAFEINTYPMIKCNVSRQTQERIYHLPMDQQYDRVKIGDHSDDFFANTVIEAESAGFRRAYRWRVGGGDD